MKKIFFILVAILLPAVLLAQPMDTTIIFREDFEGDSIKNTTKQEADLGKNYIERNTSNFASGVYYYTLYYKDVVLTKNMMINR